MILATKKSYWHNLLYVNMHWVYFLLVIGIFHFGSSYLIEEYYAVHLPHYDSIGSYTYAFQIIQKFREAGWGEAFEHATKFSFSQTQALFTALLALVLEPSPSSLQVYNTFCLSIALLCVYWTARAFRASREKACLASLIIFLPDTLYWWQGGLLDWQRDPSFLLLLTSCFFIFYRYLMYPSKLTGICFGVIVGLSLLSRDSSGPYVLITVGVPAAVWVLWRMGRGQIRAALLWSLWPSIAAAPFITYFAVVQLIPTYQRFNNAFVAYAVGNDILASIMGNWYVPIGLILGVNYGYGGTMISNAIFWLVAATGIIALAISGRLNIRPVGQPALALLVGGIWTFVATLIFLFVIIKYKPLSFGQAKHPFYATLLLFYACAFFAVLSLKLRVKNACTRVILLAFITVAVLAAGVYRIEQKTLPEEPELMLVVSDLLEFMAGEPQKVVAFLWHEGISIDVLKYYAAQRGVAPPRKFRFAGPNGESLDPEIVVPAGVDIAQLSERFYKAMICGADYFVLAEDPEQYENDRHPLYLYRYGRPVVERLLAYPSATRSFSFESRGIPIIVLRNDGRRNSDQSC